MKKLILFLITLFTFALTSTQAQTVYVTKTGKKYHIESCRYLSRSKFSIDLKDAIDRGFTPCSVCKPSSGYSSQPVNSNQSAPVYQDKPKSNTEYQSTSVQCSAITKAKTRCKRMTKSATGLCWQHGGN